MSVAQYANSFFLFQDIKSVVQAIPNAYAMDLIDFHSFLSFKLAYFSARQLNVFHVGSYFLTRMQFSEARVDIQSYLLFKQSI